jgi:Pyruvate/2-oxoacid:ferredoxin oxidoreductase delta subunit
MNYSKLDASLQLTSPGTHLDGVQRTGLIAVGVGLVAVFSAFMGQLGSLIPFWIGVGGVVVGTILYSWRTYMSRPAGVRNDGTVHSSVIGRGAVGWMLGVALTGFYVLLDWVPESMTHLASATDWLSQWIRGKPSDRWFVYGLFYTLAVGVMGIRALVRYRHSRYQIVRTLSVVFFQTGFGFIIPGLLQLFNQPEFYFHYFWPLKYDYLFPGTVGYLVEAPGALGVFMVFWGGMMTVIATPILTYFFGKRWYCSWVCGCGALANTAGDSFRHLSDKSLKSWKIERYTVHGALALVTLGTLLLWINSALGGWVLGSLSGAFSQWYGFFFGLIWAGVIGVGFYPLMGTRVWCRFGCPMAAILGLIQRKFSRFRITTNGGQCISCGNCSKYCEMGIDVRWYAQRGQNIVRASCVGCGMCSTVCPRGVLNLENGPLEGRLGESAVTVRLEEVDIL